MRIENFLRRETTPPRAQNWASPSFSAILHESIGEKTLAGGYPSEPRDMLELLQSEDAHPVSEPEEKYCSVCGCMLDEKGNCPLCIVPVLISGKQLSKDQNASRAGGANAVPGSGYSILSKTGRNRADASLTAARAHAVQEKPLDGKKPSEAKDSLKARHLKEDVHEASEPLTKFCPICGCMIGQAGSCPLCSMQQTPISGGTHPQSQSVSQADTPHSISGSGAAIPQKAAGSV